MPFTGPGADIEQAVYGKATPVIRRAGRAQAAAAETAKLVEQTLGPALLGAQNVGAQLPDLAVVGGDDLLLVDDGLANNGCRCSW